MKIVKKYQTPAGPLPILSFNVEKEKEPEPVNYPLIFTPEGGEEYLKELDTAKLENWMNSHPLDDGIVFSGDYIDSPGFKSRGRQNALLYQPCNNPTYLQIVPRYFRDYENGKDASRPNPQLIVQEDPIGSNFQYANNQIIFDPSQYDNYLTSIKFAKYPQEIIAHEGGHWIESNSPHASVYPDMILEWNTSNNVRSLQYPIFRNSKSYIDFLDAIENVDVPYVRNDNFIQEYKAHPERFVDINHDGAPTESYADLIWLRYMLQRSGIFDSINQDTSTIFNQQHLNRAKKAFPHLRIFQNFSDEDIIIMMNTIALNDTKNIDYNKPLYAKLGILINNETYKKILDSMDKNAHVS